jgi:hypothetical protein
MTWASNTSAKSSILPLASFSTAWRGLTANVTIASNEWRLSAAADEVEEGRKSYRRINLVGLGRLNGDGYGDCKERLPCVNCLAWCWRHEGNGAAAGNPGNEDNPSHRKPLRGHQKSGWQGSGRITPRSASASGGRVCIGSMTILMADPEP